MKQYLTMLLAGLLLVTFFDAWACDYEKQNCPKGYYCVYIHKAEAVCKKEFTKELLSLDFPFKHKIPTTCHQGTLSPNEYWSHSYQNTEFALDLAPSRKNQTIFSGVNGKAVVYSKCKPPIDSSGNINADTCGAGFGNTVQILLDSGFLVQYAHLNKIFVKTGDLVKKGDALGTEGYTGAAGYRHLHLSVHFDWRPLGFNYLKKVSEIDDSMNPISHEKIEEIEKKWREKKISNAELDALIPPKMKIYQQMSTIPFKLKFRTNPQGESKYQDVRKIHCLSNNPNAKPLYK